MTQRISFALLMMVPALHVGLQGQALEEHNYRQETSAVTSPFGEANAAYEPELERTNYLDLGLSTETLFDDNVFSTATDIHSDLAYIIAPNIGIRQSRGRLDWKFNYKGGFTAHQKFDAYNQGAHNFEGGLFYKLAPHVDFAIADRFLKTTGLFNQLQAEAPNRGTVRRQPNQSVVIPLADQSSNLALVEINDQYSAKSTIGGGVGFHTLRFGKSPAGSLLLDTDSQEAEGYYNHRISERNLLGLMYRFQRFTFDVANSNTTVHSMLGTYELAMQKQSTLTFFAGPEYISSGVIAGTGQQKTLTAAAGAAFEYNGVRTGIAASVSRTISDGGGLLRTVNLTQASGTVRLHWSDKWSTEMGGGYGNNDPLGTAAVAAVPYSQLNDASGRVGVTRDIATWKLSLGYARIFQSQNVIGNGNNDVRHNAAWLSVSYQFTRALGRD